MRVMLIKGANDNNRFAGSLRAKREDEFSQHFYSPLSERIVKYFLIISLFCGGRLSI